MSPLATFHPTVQRWFADTLGEPTSAQVLGWPRIATGEHTLIAAPTGSGKTLAAFLWALDGLLKQGSSLRDETQILYVSPLRALSNDVQKNLAAPLARLREIDPSLPEVRVLVRTGDTPQKDREAMKRRPPHVLVTTPESLYLLLTSGGGRKVLATVKTVIVDEVHAVVGDKRGSHLALSLERLVALAGEFQRIGLSATQKPLSDVARFLVGAGRECALVDAGTYRAMDVAVELPPSELQVICSHEVWGEIYRRVAELVREHKTTLVFVNTRKLAERVSAQLSNLLGEDQVGCHHSSLSRERRLDTEQKLKAGQLKAIVATSSLELGIDVGDVDLAIQIGATRTIATFLQRIGRSGHMIRKVPKGRLFPLTLDELSEAAGLMKALHEGELDRTPQPRAPLDILAQQIVAACVGGAWTESGLFDACRRAWPYRELTRADFDAVVKLHTDGRHALLHRDGVGGRLLATKRARMTAIQSGGAIPDVADWQVLQEPEATFVGTVNEDFAIEANHGDVFQLGNASWRIVRQEKGTLRVVDARGAPPTLPFWIGEAPSRTPELSAQISQVRELCADVLAQAKRDQKPREERRTLAAEAVAKRSHLPLPAAGQVADQIGAGLAVLGAVPTTTRIVAERFFDESGGMQMVLHAPFGGRVNRALGLALRKRFCRGFGFELQAAANEDAVVISLGTMHSFPLEEVFDYLHPDGARELLIQALLAQPMFTTRWRWNLTRSLLMERMKDGKRVPAPLQRMRSEDRLAAAFPQVIACGETLPPGDIPVPYDHPIVRQTVEDCLHEVLDVDGFLAVVRGLHEKTIERVAVDTAEPSAFARSILAIKPYGFLDDAPLEERRTQAVLQRHVLEKEDADTIGALDPDAVAQVRSEAWPTPESAEEVHEALGWMGWVTDEEAAPWRRWLDELAAACCVVHEEPVEERGGRWLAADSTRDPVAMWKGRLEALGPIAESRENSAALYTLEQQGVVLRTRVHGKAHWCERRLLARIHRYTLEKLRKEIEPVSAAVFLRFLAKWQHLGAGGEDGDDKDQVDGPQGLLTLVQQLAGFEVPAAAWESQVLPRRMRTFRREWLDQLALSGEIAWGRLWGGGAAPIRTTPICLLPRAELPHWMELTAPPAYEEISGSARDLLAALDQHGAMFPRDLQKAARLLESHFESGLQELVARGAITCDSYGALRQLIVPPSRRRLPVLTVGRWSRFRREDAAPAEARTFTPAHVEFVARQLLKRWGVVFRRVLMRERIPIPYRDLVRVYRTLELRGEIRGGRFIAGFDGEQYALPESIAMLRKVRRDHEQSPRAAVEVAAADPLNLVGILTPDDRVAAGRRRNVAVG